MARKLLVFCVCLVVLTCGITATIPPAIACDLAAKVKVLQSTYSPQQGSNSSSSLPTDPSNQQNYSLRSEIIQDLRDAFNNAPPYVQAHLCSLTGIFITSTGCPFGNVNSCYPFNGRLFAGTVPTSWGYRSISGQDKGSTYIAISGGLWYLPPQLPLFTPQHAEPFYQYETSILQYFAPWSNGPSISSPADSWMTVLAALTHELGHVRWAETVSPNGPGKNYKFDALENCSIGNNTYINFFSFPNTNPPSGWDYGKNGNIKERLRPKDRFRYFGIRTNDNKEAYTEHSSYPYLHDFYYGTATNQEVFDLYQHGQPWASLFGAQTPDEDFVETYVMYALLGNKLLNTPYNGPYLASLPVSIPGQTGSADVPADLLAIPTLKPNLVNKIICLDGLEKVSATPRR